MADALRRRLEVILHHIGIHYANNGGNAQRIPVDVIRSLVLFQVDFFGFPRDLIPYMVNQDQLARDMIDAMGFDQFRMASLMIVMVPQAEAIARADGIDVVRNQEEFIGFPHINNQGRIPRAHFADAVEWIQNKQQAPDFFDDDDDNQQ